MLACSASVITVHVPVAGDMMVFAASVAVLVGVQII
jgi:hypothetical protein